MPRDDPAPAASAWGWRPGCCCPQTSGCIHHRGAFTIGAHSSGVTVPRFCRGIHPGPHFPLRGGAVDLLAQGRPLVGPFVGRGASPSPGNELGRGAGEDIPAERALGLGVLRPLCCAGLNAPFLHALGPPLREPRSPGRRRLGGGSAQGLAVFGVRVRVRDPGRGGAGRGPLIFVPASALQAPGSLTPESSFGSGLC